MKKSLTSLFAMAAVVGLLASASAVATPTFSIDVQGPSSSVFGGLFSGADILAPTPPAPGPGPLPAPTIVIPSLLLGFVPLPVGVMEVDALSYGRDHINQPVVFSVDEFAIGLPATPLPPNVATEGTTGSMEASADVFSGLAPPYSLPAPIFGNTALFDGDGFAPWGGPGLGLVEPNPPTPFVPLPDPGDNLDAFDLDTPVGATFPVFFSLDSSFLDPIEPGGLLFPVNTGTALANGVVGGDILFATGPGLGGVYATAAMLGLDTFGTDTDDLDALVLWEDGDLSHSPADFLLFSVRRASGIIGTLDSLLGLPIEEGDVLISPVTLGLPAGSPPGIYIPAEAIGLATVRSGAVLQHSGFGDELDALDTIPEPASLSLLALGGVALLRRRRA